MTSDETPGAEKVQPETEEPTASAPIDERLQKLLDRAFYGRGSESAQALRNFLNGTWLGEPLHAALTDVPLGAWSAALAFDFLDCFRDGPEFAQAADASIALGLAGAAGAAVAGLADWSDVDPPARRLGMFHGLLNVGATALFGASFLCRKKEKRTWGRVYAGMGFAMVLASAKLGGVMVYKHRVGVDRTNGQNLPEEFVEVMNEPDLENEKPTRVEHDGVPILLVRRGTKIFALAETCSHFGAPLSEGTLVGDSIVCPWHMSRFALADGSVINGPAVHPQPCLEARVRDGKVEVRKSSCGRVDYALPFVPASALTGERS